MNRLEFLNDKVKKVDERFEVMIYDDTFTDLYFDGKKVCFIDLFGEMEPFNAEETKLIKQAFAETLAEGTKAFRDAYNQLEGR